MITFENVIFEEQFNILWFPGKFMYLEKVMPLKYPFASISNYFILFKNCNFTRSISTRGRVHFWVHPVNPKSFGRETRPTNRHSYGNTFGNNFVWFGGLGPKLRLFSVHLIHSTSFNQNPSMMISWFINIFKVYIAMIKYRRHFLLKISISHDITIL